jgi:flagellar assembly factor FliW
VKINTVRFGELEVNKRDIINFKDGLLGFDNLSKFFVVDPGDQTLILWLQSIEAPETAFPIIEPKIFMPSYSVKLLPAELASLEFEDLSTASIYSILTIPSNVTDMSANMKAPIIINNKTNYARQIVLQDNKLEVRYPMYLELKKNIANFSSDDSTRTKVTMTKPEETVAAPAPTEEAQTEETAETTAAHTLEKH